MNRAELAEFIAKEMETTKAEADRFIRSFSDAVYKNIKDSVKITGFGTFSIVKRKARVGRNPQTGEEIKIPARTVPSFKPGLTLKMQAEKDKRK